MASDAEFDAIVVGSGATGGVAAWQLTAAGLKVLVLEAGPKLSVKQAYGNPVSNLARQLTQRWFTGAQKVQERHGGYWETNPRLYTDDAKNPYTTPEGQPYAWIRGRQVGGRSLTWGGVMLRFSDYEFQAAKRDGYEVDWPLTTKDLDPYYAKVEAFFGVHGSKEGLEQLPDGEFLEACALSPAEEKLKATVESKFGRRVIPSRGIRGRRQPEKDGAFSKLSSPGSTLTAAHATGKLTLRSDAMVVRLEIDEATGKATGVEFLDTRTKELHREKAPLVFLCASTIETLRILMSTRTAAHPEGLGSSSGVLGRYLMDHVVSNTYFTMPGFPESDEYELLGSDAILIPRYRNVGQDKAPFLRGFGLWGGVARLKFPGPLVKVKGMPFGFLAAMAETLPHRDNHVRLDETVKDAWGLPVPHIACKWTDNDVAIAKAMRADCEEMVAASGGVVTPLTELVRTPFISGFMKKMEDEWLLTVPGLFVHEVGGARMGTDRKSSVTNPYGQLWDAPNVFVTDGACWVSSGWANPTHTEMAITARACERAVAEAKRRNL
ncbi:MAG: GMC family oxidoreductase [Myxococcaceae bacterium]|nr:GMC family oxidoreductase [Myxococcaceae bacterium]